MFCESNQQSAVSQNLSVNYCIRRGVLQYAPTKTKAKTRMALKADG